MKTICPRPTLTALLGTILVLALVASGPALAQPPREAEARAEARALAFVRTVASGDATAAVALMSDNFTPSTLEAMPAEARAHILERLTRDLEGATVDGVAIEGPELRVIATRRDGHRVTFTFGFETATPYRLEGLSVALGDVDDGESGEDDRGPDLRPGMSREEMAAAIGGYLDQRAARGELSGTVLVSLHGEPVFRGAYGLAHRGFGIPNHLGTRFDLGSINKLFTHVAVARLLADRKLSLDDTVARWLPDYPNREVAEKITVRQLVNHSSGLGDIFTDRFRTSSKTLYRRPEDFFPLFANEPLLFEPGTSRQYSNAGFQVLGAIVAAASGLPYSDAIQTFVFDPAGMRDTAFVARDEPTRDVAVGYTTHTDDGKLRNNLYRLPVVGSPAGSSFSTVDDLWRFVNALLGGELVPLEHAA